MNHQDIADRFRTLGDEESAALKAEQARIARERESLQELCGGMGHIYVPTSWGFVDPNRTGRACAVCGKGEA